MTKNTILLGFFASAIILAGVLILVSPLVREEPASQSSGQPSAQQTKRETLVTEQDLSAVVLTAEEQQALKSEGLSMPSGQDLAAKNLQSVRISDGISDIEKDISETNLSGLDSELSDIDKDLSGM